MKELKVAAREVTQVAYLTTHVGGGPEMLHRLCSNPSLSAEMLRALAVGGAAEEVVQDAKRWRRSWPPHGDCGQITARQRLQSCVMGVSLVLTATTSSSAAAEIAPRDRRGQPPPAVCSAARRAKDPMRLVQPPIGVGAVVAWTQQI